MGMSWGEAGVADGLDNATRDACLHGLGDHYAAGRLSAAELEARVQLVLAAQTEDELASVMAGLEDEPAADRQLPAPRPVGSQARHVLRALVGFLARRVVLEPSRRNPQEVPADAAPGSPHAGASRDASEDDVRGPDAPGPDVRGSDVPGAVVVEPVDTPRAGPVTGGIVPRRVRLNGGVIPSQRDGD